MTRNLPKPARRGHALLGAAKIERAFQAERPQHVDIGLGKVSEMVGTEDLPPADHTAVSAGIAAKIAEIAGAGEIEMAGRGISHRLSLSHHPRQRNDRQGIPRAVASSILIILI